MPPALTVTILGSNKCGVYSQFRGRPHLQPRVVDRLSLEILGELFLRVEPAADPSVARDFIQPALQVRYQSRVESSIVRKECLQLKTIALGLRLPSTDELPGPDHPSGGSNTPIHFHPDTRARFKGRWTPPCETDALGKP